MYKRTDSNQSEILDALRAIGCSVFVTSHVRGFVDIVVGYRGINYLFEIKTLKGKVNKTQTKLHSEWQGKIHVVRCIDDCISIFNNK